MERDGRPNAPRLVVLTVLLALLGFFFERQTGSKIGSGALTAFNALFVPLLGAIWAIAYGKNADGEEAKGREGEPSGYLRSLLAFGTRPGPLVALAVTYGLLSTHCSAVVVRLDERGGARDVKVGDEEVALSREAPEAIVPCWTLLAGKSYRVRVAGFEPRSVSVHPWRRTTVRVPGDLTPTPVLLVRAPASMAGIAPSTRIELLAVGSDGMESELAPSVPLREHRTAAAFGAPRPIPDGLIRGWELELLRLSADASMARTHVANWEHPLGFGPVSIDRGAELRARLVNTNSDTVLAERSFSFLPDERGWFDVLLLETPAKEGDG